MSPRLTCSCILFLCALAACDGGGGGSVRAEWADAQRRFHHGDLTAHARWIRIPRATPEGRRARSLLASADAHYRTGLRELRQGDPRARSEFERGRATAPIDPALYLPLARLYTSRHLPDRAKEFYLKFLAGCPDHPEAPAARRALRALDPELAAVLPPPHDHLVPPWLAGALAGLALALSVVLSLRLFRGRGVSLERLAQDSPELHPAIAYLIGVLRHELLKHRIGAVADVLAALARGEATDAQRAFLRHRLFGGVPLREAWEGHLQSFERALGPRLDLRRDRRFRAAGRSIRTLAVLERRGSAAWDGDARTAHRLLRAHARLRDLDRELGALVAELVRTRVDDAFLEQVWQEVRGEYAAGSVKLDEVVLAEVPEPVEVEVFHVDLLVVLKNIVRNAVLAVGEDAPPRRVGLDVRVDLEPTGEEVVRLRVRDSSATPLSEDALDGRRVERGLGLVATALARYDGAIEIEPPAGGWAKGVTVRFFRALDAA